MSGNYKMDMTFGTNDSKEFQNRMALTADGAIKGFIYQSATLDVASLADAAGASNDVTVNGVAIGDICVGVSFGVDIVDVLIHGDVTAANVVTVRVQNESGGAVNLASTTIRILVADVT